MAKHVAFVLTINNPNYPEQCIPEDLTFLQNHGILYLVSGMEGLSFGRTKHMQICLCFTKPKSWKEVKTIFPRAYIDHLRYDFDLACDYCKKEGFYQTFGDMDIAKKLIHELKVKQENRAARLVEKGNKKGEIKRGISITPVISPIDLDPTTSPSREAGLNKEQGEDPNHHLISRHMYDSDIEYDDAVEELESFRAAAKRMTADDFRY